MKWKPACPCECHCESTSQKEPTGRKHIKEWVSKYIPKPVLCGAALGSLLSVPVTSLLAGMFGFVVTLILIVLIEFIVEKCYVQK